MDGAFKSGTFSFGTNNGVVSQSNDEAKKSEPSFSFGLSTTNSNTNVDLNTPSFTLGNSGNADKLSKTTTHESSKPFLFGNNKVDESPLFGLNAPKKDQPSFGFNASREEKPSFSFNVSKEDKSSFEFDLPKQDTTIIETKPAITDKSKDDEFLKSYQAPSVQHDDEMNIGADDEEFFDIDIDKNTNLPIRKLDFDENPRSLLNKKNNDHLQLTISNKTEKGVLFITNSDGSKKDKVEEKNTDLFEFDLLPYLDTSVEYKEFLNAIYKEFEPLLKDKQYQHYLNDDKDDEYMNIGVVSNNKEIQHERKLFLRKLMSSFLNNLQILISKKMKKDFGQFSDQWVINFEQITHILYLLNALHFGNSNETIVLFQQWIERIDIQPDEDLLETVFEESDRPYKNSLFWSIYVKKFLLRGGFSTIVDAFKVSQYEELKEMDNDLFNLIEEFIALITTYDPIQFSYDITAFLKWKRQAVELREYCQSLNTQNVLIQSEVLELLNIISGSSPTIEKSSATWYENFMGHFLYQMPSKKLINEYIEKSLLLDSYEIPIEGIETWDSICIDLFRNKYLMVIASIESLDKSIGTFMAILIESSGLLNSYSNKTEDIIEQKETSDGISNNIDRMVEDLALTYLNNQDLFAVGVGILISIGSNKSREILSELLPTYEIKDSDDFEWILSICSKLQLTNTMSRINEIQGDRFLSKQLIPNALNCFAESNSTDKVISIIWRLFEDTLLNQGLDEKLSLQLFDNTITKSNAILRQSLSPLYTLNEIVKSDCTHDQTWYNRLIGLFEFKYLPEYYKTGLLLLIFDNLNQGIFNLDNLVNMIDNINEFEKVLSRDDDVRNKSDAMYLLLRNSRHVDASKYPTSVPELFRTVRRGLALDVSFAFLDESQAGK